MVDIITWTAVLTVVLAGLIAYPLSRYEMRYKRIFMLGMLFMTSLPITTVMVPVYKLFVMVKLYDNIAGVTLFMTAANLPYAIWMMKNFRILCQLRWKKQHGLMVRAN